MTPLISYDQILMPILLALLSGGIITGWFEFRSRNKKAPIDTALASSLMSEQAGKLALSIAERQETELKDLKKDMKTQRTDMDAIAAELAKKSLLLDKVVNVIHGFREWYDGKIVQQWDTVRQNPVPPDPPVEMRNWDDHYSSFLD